MTRKEQIEEIDQLIEESNLHFNSYGFSKAEEIINIAIRKAETYGITEKVIECLTELGYYQVKEIGNVELARECYFKCIELIKQTSGNHELLADYYYGIGGTYYLRDWNRLIEFHNIALDYYSFDDDYIKHYRIYRDLGDAYKNLNNLELAEKSYLKALEINLMANPKYLTELPWQHLLKELSDVYLKMGNEKKHLEYKERSERALNDYNEGKHLKKK